MTVARFNPARTVVTVPRPEPEQLGIPMLEVPIYAKGMSLAERFAAFSRQNPHVEAAIAGIANELLRTGFKRCSMKMIFEQMRWRYALQTKGDAYKLNNNYTAFYARQIMATHPNLEGFFETRESPKK